MPIDNKNIGGGGGSKQCLPIDWKDSFKRFHRISYTGLAGNVEWHYM